MASSRRYGVNRPEQFSGRQLLALKTVKRSAPCGTTVRPQAKQWYDGPDALAFLSVQPNRLEPLVRAQRVLAPPPASRRPYRP
jgi:hypothetical protein